MRLTDIIEAKVAEKVATLPAGKSAYDIYVEKSEDALLLSEEAWLESLKGEDGITPQKGVDYFDGITPDTSDFVQTDDARLSDARTPLSHIHPYESANGNIQTHVTSPHAPSNAEANVNADWNAGSGDAQILNKPTIPTAQVQSDWNAGSGMGQILNKPTIPTALASLTDDATHRLVTDTEKTAWNAAADPFTRLIVSGDKATGANTTPVTLGISFAYEANHTYVIDFYMIVAPTAATTGCTFPIDVSTAVTYLGTFTIHQLATSGTVSGAGTIGDLGATSKGVSSGMVGTGSNFVSGSALLITGANPGTATFFFGSETTAVTTCKSGSAVRVMKVN